MQRTSAQLQKKFWSFIAHKRKDRTGISPLQSEKGTVSNNQEKTEILNKHYGSIFTKDNPDIIPSLPNNPLPEMSMS